MTEVLRKISVFTRTDVGLIRAMAADVKALYDTTSDPELLEEWQRRESLADRIEALLPPDAA